MKRQNERTHSGQTPVKVSDLTIGTLDRQTRWEFGKWIIRFQQRIRAGERAAAWNTLGEGCLDEDLYWAFFFAIDDIDSATSFPSRFLTFREDSFDVLREIRRLRPTVHKLMEAKLWAEPLWYQFLGFYELPLKQVLQFWKFQYELAFFEARLKQFTGRGTSRTTVTALKASIASHGEAVLHIYVKESTGKFYYEETSILLEAAAQAYNLEAGTSFAQDAVSHRYTRFRKKHRKDVEEIRRDIGELWSQRLNNNMRLDLIPYLMARRKARFQLLVREYQKISGDPSSQTDLKKIVSEINLRSARGVKMSGRHAKQI